MAVFIANRNHLVNKCGCIFIFILLSVFLFTLHKLVNFVEHTSFFLSDHETVESYNFDDKHAVEPSWGPTFDRSDDIDSVWSYNAKVKYHNSIISNWLLFICFARGASCSFFFSCLLSCLRRPIIRCKENIPLDLMTLVYFLQSRQILQVLQVLLERRRDRSLILFLVHHYTALVILQSFQRHQMTTLSIASPNMISSTCMIPVLLVSVRASQGSIHFVVPPTTAGVRTLQHLIP